MEKDVLECLDVPVLFGRFLVLSGLLTEADIAEAVRVQKDLNAYPLFRLIEQGVLSIDDVMRARAYQWARMMTFCQAQDALGLMTLDECAAALKAVSQQNIPLGEILVKQGRITSEALANALEKHRQYQDHRVGDVFQAT